ncbi:hypothetical protein CCACVL1_10671, partial [Corchorus capsularis]
TTPSSILKIKEFTQIWMENGRESYPFELVDMLLEAELAKEELITPHT